MSTGTDASPAPTAQSELRAAAQDWIAAFTELVTTRDTAAVDRLFIPQGFWRDVLAFTWDIRSAIGADGIRDLVDSHIADSGVNSVVLTSDPHMVDGGPTGTWLQAELTLDGENGSGRGLLRLVPAGSTWAAMSLITQLTSVGDRPRLRTQWSDRGNTLWTTAEKGRQNWVDSKDPERPFATTEPAVLVVGAGQCGLALAAQLERMGVDALVIDRSERLGDSWRRRHYNLITHTPSFTDHLPFLPFPDNWPISAPKDRLANWIESYADALGIDVWTRTEMLGGTYHPEDGVWTIEVRRSTGETQIIRPRQLVLATGLLSLPSVPDLQGRERFAGQILHSSEYGSGADYLGKRVVVVGSGASGHDIAQDLYEHGVEHVTMVQRSPTYVMSFEHGIFANYGPFYSEASVQDLDATDLAFKSFPLPVAIEAGRAAAPMIAQQDAKLLDGLRGIGFQLKDGGMLANGLTPGVGGYYINQGCSELLISGEIGFKTGCVVGFDETGLLFADGSKLDADAVVLCTGYHNMREQTRDLLGEEVWQRCKQAWVLDLERGGEHGALWTDSGYPHLWLMAGSLHYARLYSSTLALRIKAELMGIVPTRDG